jgi:hypothetical protein
MHHGFLAATLVLGLMPAVLIAVAIIWYRRSTRGAGNRPPPEKGISP